MCSWSPGLSSYSNFSTSKRVKIRFASCVFEGGKKSLVVVGGSIWGDSDEGITPASKYCLEGDNQTERTYLPTTDTRDGFEPKPLDGLTITEIEYLLLITPCYEKN